MVDALTLERRGTPAVVVAIDKLVRTTGRAMARAQGVPDYPMAVIPTPEERSAMDSVTGDEDIDEMAKSVVGQVEAILITRKF